jgi:hypothetical protein
MNNYEIFDNTYKVLVIDTIHDKGTESLIEKLNNGISEVITVDSVNRAISLIGVVGIDYVVWTTPIGGQNFLDFCRRNHVPCSLYFSNEHKIKKRKKSAVNIQIYRDAGNLVAHVRKNLMKKQYCTKSGCGVSPLLV